KNETENNYIIAMQLQEMYNKERTNISKEYEKTPKRILNKFIDKKFGERELYNKNFFQSNSNDLIMKFLLLFTTHLKKAAPIFAAIFAVISASVPTTIFTVSTTDLLITNKCFHEIQNQKNNIQSDYDTYNNQNQKNNNQSYYDIYNTNFSQKPNR
ncbi:6672_t:CDS:2, partial [Gigaspora rosea]